MKLTCGRQWAGMKVSIVTFRLISQTKHFCGQLAWERIDPPSSFQPPGGVKAILVFPLTTDSAAPGDFKESTSLSFL